LLPVLSLVVWGVAVMVPAVQTYLELRGVAAEGKSAAVSVEGFQGTVLPANFWTFALNAAVVTHSHALTAMELPGAFVEMPIPVAVTRPSLWYPQHLDQGTGGLLTMPVYCLPAWWLVGMGVEALLGRRRVRRVMVGLGSLVWGLFVFLLGGYLVGWLVPGRTVEDWVLVGFGLWVGMFGVLPVAGFVRRVDSKY
jgi:hypothetical protein